MRDSVGACRPDIRSQLEQGDHIFVVSGKIPEVSQFVMAGFEIESKIAASKAYDLFPELRLHKLEDGQLTGNIIVDANGKRHQLDDHTSFDKRIKNYVVGTNLISISTPEEIDEGRKHTLDALRDILHKRGNSPVTVVGRWGTKLTDKQVLQLRDWLVALKTSSN